MQVFGALPTSSDVCDVAILLWLGLVLRRCCSGIVVKQIIQDKNLYDINVESNSILLSYSLLYKIRLSTIFTFAGSFFYSYDIFIARLFGFYSTLLGRARFLFPWFIKSIIDCIYLINKKLNIMYCFTD